MAYRAYVGNLPFSFTKAELEQLFQPFGTVKSAEVITDRETGRSRGFGFVEMETQEQLQASMEGLHGKPIGGRSLTVNEARERDARGPGGGGGFRSGPPRGPGGPPSGGGGFGAPRPGGFGAPRPASPGPTAPGPGRKSERDDRDRAKKGRGMDDYDRHDKSWKRGDDQGW